MNKIFKLRYLFILVLLISFVAVISPKVSAFNKTANSAYLVAQSGSSFDEYMHLGYSETKKRNYRKALEYFQQAEKLKPRDSFATAAIRNVQGYIDRGRSTLAFYVGSPDRRRAAATRGMCNLKENENLTALVPTEKEKDNPEIVTTAEYPSFFFYVPKIARAEKLRFILQDIQAKKDLYKVELQPNSNPGIIKISIPENTSESLSDGKKYSWTLSVICDNSKLDDSSFITGFIKRVQPDQNLTNQLQSASAQERTTLYATTGYWEDTLRTLANLRLQRPSDTKLKEDWEDFLESVDLAPEAIKAPLLF
ncbi:MAG: DUF928 domain-containing protein [Scytonematopsis contorta HA4267-MV1]|jgi:hypothetical protein|nr:DUF928 domain-containing protein [Scytonematopsis contorta HA4267-MV1]